MISGFNAHGLHLLFQLAPWVWTRIRPVELILDLVVVLDIVTLDHGFLDEFLGTVSPHAPLIKRTHNHLQHHFVPMLSCFRLDSCTPSSRSTTNAFMHRRLYPNVYVLASPDQ